MVIFLIRLRKKDLQFKAEITAFLSLVFILMLSVISALLSSAMIYAKESNERAKMSLGLESVFAEYDRKMLEDYDIFARADSDEKEIINQLNHYIGEGTEQKLLEWEVLTDHDGMPYYQSAIRYVKDWLCMEADGPDLEQSLNMETLEKQTEEKLDSLLSQEENTLLEDDNPLTNINRLKNSNLLSILVTDRDQISKQTIETASLPSHRTLQKGNRPAAKSEGTDKALFITYLRNHFTNALENEEEHALSYELEYILCGNGTDKANLEQVLKKILLIRMGVNYTYLQTDETKKAEAGALAAVLCALTTTPGMTEAVKQALLLAWAYGESILDLRVLMKQGKVPVVKTSENWQMKLSNLRKLGTDQEAKEEKDNEKGLSYMDYLTGLLLLEKRETLCMRSLDLIEANLDIQVDRCVTRAMVQNKNRFQTEFYYK